MAQAKVLRIEGRRVTVRVRRIAGSEIVILPDGVSVDAGDLVEVGRVPNNPYRVYRYRVGADGCAAGKAV